MGSDEGRYKGMVAGNVRGCTDDELPYYNVIRAVVCAF